MAIAPLPDTRDPFGGSCDLLEIPWPTAGPTLRLIAPGVGDLPATGRPATGRPGSHCAPGRAGASPGDEPAEGGAVGARCRGGERVRLGLDVAIRRRRRRARQVRRRRLALGGAVVALVTGLAVPWSATGGRALARPIARYGPSVASATVYVVQPGDTLWSIAAKFDRVGDPRSLARAIARETGSETVVPGERIALP
jgi:hypothetical protein